jgi:hypothetical protein
LEVIVILISKYVEICLSILFDVSSHNHRIQSLTGPLVQGVGSPQFLIFLMYLGLVNKHWDKYKLIKIQLIYKKSSEVVLSILVGWEIMNGECFSEGCPHPM